MSKNIKKTFFILILVAGLFCLLGEDPDNSEFRQKLNSVSDVQIVIIFNSGGWGNTPLEKADDFRPVIEGIQKTLGDLGYDSVVIPYKRTKRDFFGLIEGIKETITSFREQSRKLASEINDFFSRHPDNKVIIAGLSNGGAFVNNVVKKIADDKKDNLFAIEAGTPFWEKVEESNNVLLLDRDGNDPLASGSLKVLVSVLFKAPFEWAMSQISKEKISLSQAFYFPGHYYDWDDVALEVRSFLEGNFVLF